jgi:CRISPR-associated endonuclease/helicase Cas3
MGIEFTGGKTMEPIAHTQNSQGKRQPLIDHLLQVAELASIFAKPLDASYLAYLAGLLHDIGKFNPEFQEYLLNAEAGIKGRGPDHKGAGTIQSLQMGIEPLAFLISGHHGGLLNRSGLKNRLLEWGQDAAIQATVAKAKEMLPCIDQKTSLLLPSLKDATEGELFIRLLFSCLVDSDFLDTEKHFNAARSSQRGLSVLVSDLWSQFEEYHRKKSQEAKPSIVNDVRKIIYQHCYEAAELRPGFFRLTAPTGGGKTLSSLAFALRHAKLHNKKRIIYAIPFTSIIDQTAKEFREMFSGDIVLEHHSSVVPPDDPDNVLPGEIWRRLSAENWDPAIVVTTTVQLFESLFSNSTGACRKLHNIAESVIVLDEVQALPAHLLEPILDVLQQLAGRYGVSIILCTATQPTLENRMNFKGLKDSIHEIISNQDLLQIFSSLSRVEYQWSTKKWTWEDVAERAKQSKQALVVVNTKKDAVIAAKAFHDDDVLHLSTSMCAAHRRAVLEMAKQRLYDKKSCYLISTQLIEAGVDIDFPLVLRALCPLDSAVQAAGRCNRNGELPHKGITIIFDPIEGGTLKSYEIGIATLQEMIEEKTVNPEDPGTFQRYFKKIYARKDIDKFGIQGMRKRLAYEEVAKTFRMIEDEAVSIVVFYDQQHVENLLDDLCQNPQKARTIIRQLQPYMVSIRKDVAEKAMKQGLIGEESSGILVWRDQDGYDSTYGLVELTIGKRCYIL